MGHRNINSNTPMNNLDHGQQPQFQLHPDPCVISNYPQPNMNRLLPIPEPMAAFVPHHISGNSENNLPYLMTQYHHGPPATPSNYYTPYAIPPGSSAFPPQINQDPSFVDGFGAAFKRKISDGHNGNFQYGSSMGGPSSVGGETVLSHNPNNFIQGNNLVRALPPAGAPWVWGQAPAIPYLHGNGVSRIPTNFQPQLPQMYPQGHPQALHHLPPQPVQGPFYPQLSGSPYLNNFQGGMEVGPSFVRPPVPTGIAVYHHPSHGRAVPLPGVAMRPHHALPPLNILPVEEIAMLETGNAVDHHRDMRMDVDSMSYEELLALEEHIGNVTVGLSENTIFNHLEIRSHIAPTTSTELEDMEINFCTICQTNYENKEIIGTLDCGHEYHVDCIKKWLIIKNICPICKSSALTTKRKDSTTEG